MTTRSTDPMLEIDSLFYNSPMLPGRTLQDICQPPAGGRSSMCTAGEFASLCEHFRLNGLPVFLIADTAKPHVRYLMGIIEIMRRPSLLTPDAHAWVITDYATRVLYFSPDEWLAGTCKAAEIGTPQFWFSGIGDVADVRRYRNNGIDSATLRSVVHTQYRLAPGALCDSSNALWNATIEQNRALMQENKVMKIALMRTAAGELDREISTALTTAIDIECKRHNSILVSADMIIRRALLLLSKELNKKIVL